MAGGGETAAPWPRQQQRRSRVAVTLAAKPAPPLLRTGAAGGEAGVSAAPHRPHRTRSRRCSSSLAEEPLLCHGPTGNGEMPTDQGVCGTKEGSMLPPLPGLCSEEQHHCTPFRLSWQCPFDPLQASTELPALVFDQLPANCGFCWTGIGTWATLRSSRVSAEPIALAFTLCSAPHCLDRVQQVFERLSARDGCSPTCRRRRRHRHGSACAAAGGGFQGSTAGRGGCPRHYMLAHQDPGACSHQQRQLAIPTDLALGFLPAAGPRCLGGPRRSAAGSSGSSPSRLPKSSGPCHHAAPAGPRSTQWRQTGARGGGGVPARR